jgi:hypothetical protein
VSGVVLGLWRRQRDDVGQTLQQQFQLVFVQTFIALTAEVMADILIELLAQQPVLGSNAGIFPALISSLF